MKLIKTELKDLTIIKHNVFFDERGCFKEIFVKEKLEKFINKKINFCQQNCVKSNLNVLRGLHFQREPFEQSKLVSVEQGKILDVVVDIRKDSQTYGRYLSYILSSEKHESIFIPRGFAHGYLTLSKTATINYLVDNYYNKSFEDGISFNDHFLNIDWGIDLDKIICSEKDKNYKTFEW